MKNMSAKSIFIITLLFAYILLPMTSAQSEICKKASVTMILPDIEENLFWGPYAHFTQAAAEKLNIDLTILFSPANDRYNYIQRIKDLSEGTDVPDYFAVFPFVSKTQELMEIVEKSGAKFVTFNSGISQKDREAVGFPREKFKNWILHSQADDKAVGYELTKSLVKIAREYFGLVKNQSLMVSAIGGNHDTASSLMRKQGLLDFAAEDRQRMTLNQYVSSDWSYKRSLQIATGLYQRYETTHAFWTASLPIGIGALNAWKRLGKKTELPVIGTVSGPWDPQVLDLIENGKISVVLGGHFVEGALLMALIADYHNGIDFKDEIGTRFDFPLMKIDTGNFRRMKELLGDRDWKKLSYKNLSKCHSPALQQYDFNIETILQKK